MKNYFQCEVCNKLFDNKEAAENCEKLHKERKEKEERLTKEREAREKEISILVENFIHDYKDVPSITLDDSTYDELFDVSNDNFLTVLRKFIEKF